MIGPVRRGYCRGADCQGTPGRVHAHHVHSGLLSKEGADPVGNSPHKFGAYIKLEIAKWSTVVKAAKVRAN
ncbi:MAG: hypothetical protein JWN13_5803 [Betaproteobacteria bacterium]|jgi:hypothetical protein|nr:hypothetical protein [Betaproteobacteria bacterium]